MQPYFSLRVKLDDVISESDKEQLILENIRRCRYIAGKEFKVIFWHENLTESECKDFIERNEHLLCEVNTKITKKFESVWFLIKGNGDLSPSRYRYEGEVLAGIPAFLKIVKHIKGKE
tara:strand:- start:101 stop:454 length:354 start_codon:yes stop_codon:yes gene_type:complete